jgi:peptidoglycan/xylan/chitin deacetylase (PgdA/CDA1 family)
MERDHDLAWADFLILLDRLLAAGSTFARDLEAEPRDGAVVLTFDDATVGHRALAEALTKRGVPAVFFVPAGLVGTPEYLDAAALRELVAGGHIIGSHGWSHQRLDLLPEAGLTQEVDSSRSKLEDLTGVPVTLFAPVGGIEVPLLPERLQAAGYVASRSARWGIHRRLSDIWRIPAIAVTRITADRGWIDVAATELRLPVPMIALRAVADVLGPDARSVLRGRLHRWFGGAA